MYNDSMQTTSAQLYQAACALRNTLPAPLLDDALAMAQEERVTLLSRTLAYVESETPGCYVRVGNANASSQTYQCTCADSRPLCVHAVAVILERQAALPATRPEGHTFYATRFYKGYDGTENVIHEEAGEAVHYGDTWMFYGETDGLGRVVLGAHLVLHGEVRSEAA
jgi:hypothetical protein